MARGITQSDVDQACDALLQAGERPTQDRIRQLLGSGSMSIVNRTIDAWWKAPGTRLTGARATVAMPDAPPAVALLAAQLWEPALPSAREQAEAALEAERATLAARRLKADARAAAAELAVEAAQARAAEAAAALLTAHQRPKDRQRLVDLQAQQLLDLADHRDQAFIRADQVGLDAQAQPDQSQSGHASRIPAAAATIETAVRAAESDRFLVNAATVACCSEALQAQHRRCLVD